MGLLDSRLSVENVSLLVTEYLVRLINLHKLGLFVSVSSSEPELE